MQLDRNSHSLQSHSLQHMNVTAVLLVDVLPLTCLELLIEMIHRLELLTDRDDPCQASSSSEVVESRHNGHRSRSCENHCQ